ncbi:MAG TPA: hypothetical protein VGM64_02655 [Lacunisphaera sp.]|jgi:hypothetical protein
MDSPKNVDLSPLSTSAPKLSEEPGFVSIDLTGASPVCIPGAMGGLLAFIYFDGRQEIVIKILMLDNLAKGFLDNLPFSGRANRIAFLGFPVISDFAQRVQALENRLKLYGDLTRKYQNRPKHS